jgi:GntR family transcriptional regulator
MAQQPKYEQIAWDLRERIGSGQFTGGSQLPTELELMAQYNASRNTVRDAIKRLIGQGLVETRPGQGTFVTTRVDPFVTVLTVNPRSGEAADEMAAYLSEVSAGKRKPSATTPRVEVQVASEVITRRLRVAPSSQLVSRHEQRYIDNVPWSLQTTFYPMDFIARGAARLLMAEDIREGAVRYLAETIGLRQIGYRDWITVRSPDPNEELFFRIGHDATVFEIFRTAFDQNQMPMRVTVTVYPTDRNQFIIDVGSGPPDLEYSDPPDPGHQDEETKQKN